MDTLAYGKEILDIAKTKNNKNKIIQKITYDSSYRAVYQKYYINNKNYYPIKASFIIVNGKKIPVLDNRYYIDSLLDYDINDIVYGNLPNKLLDSSSLIYNYKVIQDEEGHSIETKYCINSLLNNDINVQIPRYGIYPVFSGYIGVNTSVYDY